TLLGGYRETVCDDQQLLDLREVRLAARDLVEVQHRAIGDDADEALGAQMLEDARVRELRRAGEGEGDHQSRARGPGEHRVTGGLRGIRLQLAAAVRANRAAGARPEQAQVVGDLGGRAD